MLRTRSDRFHKHIYRRNSETIRKYEFRLPVDALCSWTTVSLLNLISRTSSYRVRKAWKRGICNELVKPLIGIQRVEVPGSGRQAASLGGESPSAVSCLIRRLACPMHALVTMREVLGCKSHGCPATVKGAAAGETWVASKPGGLNVRNSDDLETPAA